MTPSECTPQQIERYRQMTGEDLLGKTTEEEAE